MTSSDVVFARLKNLPQIPTGAWLRSGIADPEKWRKDQRAERRLEALIEASEDESEEGKARWPLVYARIIQDLKTELKQCYGFKASTRQIETLMTCPNWDHVDQAMAELRKYNGFAVVKKIQSRRQLAS